MTVLAAGTAVAAGGVGFAFVFALMIAGVFLFRSLNRHLKNLPASFDPPAGPEGGTPTPPSLPRNQG